MKQAAFACVRRTAVALVALLHASACGRLGYELGEDRSQGIAIGSGSSAGAGASPSVGAAAGVGSGGASAQQACGNGSLDIGEQCDDGNRAPGDGCDASCLNECIPQSCSEVGAACGEPDDGCGSRLSCGSCQTGEGCNVAFTCAAFGKCGDAKLGPGEECDDGNVKAGDGCDATCHVECVPQDCAALSATCGAPDDGCGTALDCGSCASGNGCNLNFSCVALGRCGDGKLGPGEQCDDGNTSAGDGCDTKCQNECIPKSCASLGANCGKPDDGCGAPLSCGTCAAGLSCSAFKCAVVCGDTRVGPGEQCDDGNTLPGDGCSPSCQKECVPTSCSALGATCGSPDNGCGAPLSCGACAAGDDCNASFQCILVDECAGTYATAPGCESFEGGPTTWNKIPFTGTISAETQNVHLGSVALRLQKPGGSGNGPSVAVPINPTQGSGTFYFRGFYFIETAPSSSLVKLVAFVPSSGNDIDVNLYSDGSLDVYLQSSAQRWRSAASVAPQGQWLCLQVTVSVSDTAGKVTVNVNGSQRVASPGNVDTLTTGPISRAKVGLDYGTAPNATTILVDDVVIDTSPVPCQ